MRLGTHWTKEENHQRPAPPPPSVEVSAPSVVTLISPTSGGCQPKPGRIEATFRGSCRRAIASFVDRMVAVGSRPTSPCLIRFLECHIDHIMVVIFARSSSEKCGLHVISHAHVSRERFGSRRSKHAHASSQKGRACEQERRAWCKSSSPAKQTFSY